MKRFSIIIVLLLSFFCGYAQENDSLIFLDYHWRCRGEERECSLTVEPALLEYYRNERAHLAYRFEDTPFDSPANYFSFMCSDYDREVIQELASGLSDSIVSERYKIESALTFVQSFPYAEDKVSLGQEEYVRYPVETLVDGEGDCEDKVTLLAAIYKEMDVDFVLLVLPDHLALGVACDSVESGQYLMYEGKRYYFVETTTSDWALGQIPKDLASKRMEVVPYTDTPVLVSRGMRFESQPAIVNTKAPCSLSMQLSNMGPGKATGIQLHVQMLQSSYSGVYLLLDEVFDISDLDEGESREEIVEFRSVIKKGGVLRLTLSGDGLPDQEFDMKLSSSK